MGGSKDKQRFDHPGLTEDGVPMCVRPLWWLRGWRAPVVSACVGVSLYTILELVGYVSLGPFFIVLVPTCVLLALQHIFRGRYVAALVASAVRCDLRVCLKCGYELQSLPDRHRCPECGLAYVFDDTKEHWKRRLTARARPDGPYASSPHYDREELEAKLPSGRPPRCIRCGYDVSRIPNRECPACAAETGPG